MKPQAKKKNGKISPVILAAAAIAGVDRVFQTGGAQAIAAFAYGTESIPKVSKICGPGNAYVAEAKRQVFGPVGIDMVAGPSEILVIADGASDPAVVAADMLSQAEHDKNASAMLVTTSPDLAAATATEIDRQLETLPRKEIAETSINNNGFIMLADSIGEPSNWQMRSRRSTWSCVWMIRLPTSNRSGMRDPSYLEETVPRHWATILWEQIRHFPQAERQYTPVLCP